MTKTIQADKYNGKAPHSEKVKKNFWDQSWLHIVVIFLLVILYFGNTIRNEIALDDVMVLSENTFVKKGISGIPEIFSHDSFYGATHHAASQLGWRYRPQIGRAHV